MRKRLLTVVVPLLAGLFLALAIPLAWNIAQRQTQSVYLNRLGDAERFALLADDALSGERETAFVAEIRRYASLYGISVAVVAPEGRVVFSSRQTLDLDEKDISTGLRAAFAGYRPARFDTAWPWQTDPMVVVEPVGRGSGVLAAVVTVSPTGELRTDILRSWGLLAAAAIVPFLLSVLIVVPLSRWVLRPVRELDEASVALAAGRLDARAQQLAGPPELRRFATSFNTMAEVVTRTLRRQRTFVSDASHQLRNPLASLRIAVENLGPYVTPEGRQEHAEALEDVDEMGRIVESLLELTRMEGTTPASQPQPLEAVLRARSQRWRQQLTDAGMSLVLDVAPELRTYAPSDALGHILDELVGNAARLSGGTRVTVTAEPEVGQVVLRVRDDGSGLSADQLSRAGERFWRGPAHQNIPGTGMGLAICREVVASWGGELQLHSVTPHGLEALISLPSADANGQ